MKIKPTMKNTNLLLAFLLITAATACQRVNDKNPDLVGKWQGTEWLVFGKPSVQDASRVSFEFTAEGKFTASYGEQSESGVWRTDKSRLFTKADGREEIMVKILKLDATSLKFEMNRGGQPETIELIRQ